MQTNGELLLSTDNLPDTEPDSLVAGESWKWTKSLSDYPADTWTLTYYFLFSTGTENFSIVATADGTDYLISEDPATTAGYTPGSYKWQAFVTDGTDKFKVVCGDMEVLPDFSTSTADPRSDVEIILYAINAMLKGKANRDQMETEVNGKKIKRYSWEELREMRKYFTDELFNEGLECATSTDPSALNAARMIRHTFGRPE